MYYVLHVYYSYFVIVIISIINLLVTYLKICIFMLSFQNTALPGQAPVFTMPAQNMPNSGSRPPSYSPPSGVQGQDMAQQPYHIPPPLPSQPPVGSKSAQNADGSSQPGFPGGNDITPGYTDGSTGTVLDDKKPGVSPNTNTSSGGAPMGGGLARGYNYQSLKGQSSLKPVDKSPVSGATTNLDNITFPELPSVPDEDSLAVGGTSTNSEDVDFDDLTKRFNALKKK